jgi:hypothetical protein
MTSPSSDTPESYLNPLNDVIDRIAEGLTSIGPGFTGVIERVNDWAFLLPPPVLLWVIDKLNAVGARLNELIDKGNEAIDTYVPVVGLITTSFHWVHEVKKPVADLSSAVNDPKSRDLSRWTGEAQIAYTDIRTAQRLAVDDVVTKAEFVSLWLSKIALSHAEWAGKLLETVNMVLGAFADAIANTATVINIPFAIDTLAGVIGDLVTDVLNAAVDIAERLVQALGNVRDLAGQAGDTRALPGGHWPEGVRPA